MRTTKLEDKIIELADANDSLAEICDLIDYYPDLGRVEEHWRVKPMILRIIKETVESQEA